MKRGTPEHPKMKRLCSILCKPNYVGVGILEAMWHLVARYTPDGAIGKLANSEIARAIDWRGNPDNLINALVASGWLETCSCHRLYVHDWKDHADQTVARVLANRKLEFVISHASIVLARCYDDPSLPKPLSLPEPKALPLDSETKPVSESSETFLQPSDDGSKPKRRISPEVLEKRARQKLQQEVWFKEFRELFVWKWEGEDEAQKIFSWKVKTEDIWQQVKTAVLTQTEKQLSRPPDYRTCPTKWLLAGKWKDRKPPPGTAIESSARPLTFGELKQQRQHEIFQGLVAYDQENRK